MVSPKVEAQLSKCCKPFRTRVSYCKYLCTEYNSNIENQQLYQVLIKVDRLTLRIAFMKVQGYSTREIASYLRITEKAVYRRLDTVIIAPITSRVHTKAKIPTHTLIKDFDGLDKNSIILFEQIRTIDKQRLREYLGTLDRRFIHCADKALAISIGLAKKD